VRPIDLTASICTVPLQDRGRVAVLVNVSRFPQPPVPPPPAPRKLLATIVETEEGPSSRLMPKRREHAVLTVLAGMQLGAMHRIEGDRLIIGRAPDADLTLPDESLSWHHARILQIGTGWYIDDMQSTNGTFVGADRVLKPRRLHDGDRIGLGRRTVLKLQLQDELEAEVSERLYESMVRDGLTRAYNRLAFDERLGAEIAFARRHAASVSVIMIDLDHFKRVNDTYGHLAGDQVLRSVVRTLQSTIRAEDMLARYGGEELAIIARGITPYQAHLFAERLRQMVEAVPIDHGECALRVTASFGVATAHADAADLYASTPLVAAADAALYRAKRDGRNRVAVWPF